MVCLIAFGFAANKTMAQVHCYSTINLGAINNNPPDEPFGLNNQNQAAYSLKVGGKFHAMLYLPAPAYGFTKAGCYDLHDLAGLGANESSAAHDINENGIVVGYKTVNNKKHAFIWRLDLYDPNAIPPLPIIDMGTFPDGDESEAFAINDDSPQPWIVGEGRYAGECVCSGGSGPQQLAFAITLNLADNGLNAELAATLIADPSLYHLPDCHRNTTAYDVNTSLILTVAGNSASFGYCSEGTTRATTWTDPTLGTNNNNGAALPLLAVPRSLAKGISNLGPIVGSSTTSVAFLPHAVYWHTAAGPIVDLGSLLPTNPRSSAWRINNLTDRAVVGKAIGLPDDTAALWECSTNCDQIVGGNWSVTDLASALITSECNNSWDLIEAYDVNDNGRIIAWGWNNSNWRAVILVPDEACCPGDFDGDGTVGTSDLLALLTNWGDCSSCGPCIADLDCSGAVGTNDQLILFANWGSCSEADGGGSTSLESAVQQMGFPTVAAHQAWVAQASGPECFTSGCVLLTILQDQD